jgi:hypothetical protein
MSRAVRDNASRPPARRARLWRPSASDRRELVSPGSSVPPHVRPGEIGANWNLGPRQPARSAPPKDQRKMSPSPSPSADSGPAVEPATFGSWDHRGACPRQRSRKSGEVFSGLPGVDFTQVDISSRRRSCRPERVELGRRAFPDHVQESAWIRNRDYADVGPRRAVGVRSS